MTEVSNIDKELWHTPTLETKRLILRPLSLEDAETIFTNWTSNEEVARYMSWSVHQNLTDTLSWLEFEVSTTQSPAVYSFGCAKKETGQLIGSGGLLYDEELDRFSIGYVFMQPEWGKGYASEAARCIMDYGIQTLGIKRFFGYHAVDNPISGKIIENLGFTFVKEGIFVSDDNTKTFPRKEHFLDL